MVFKTKNSTYYVDTNRNIITGGKLGNKSFRFSNGIFMVGMPGRCILEDGRSLTTGVIIKYLG